MQSADAITPRKPAIGTAPVAREKPKRYPDTVKAQARILFATGHTLAEVAVVVGAPLNTVLAWSARGNWSQDSGQKVATQSKSQCAAIATAQNAAAYIAEKGQSYRIHAAKYAEACLKHAATVADKDPLAGLALARPTKDVHTVAKDTFEIGQPDTVVNLALLGAGMDGLSAQTGHEDSAPGAATIDI